jgi:hypothetical protein
VLLVLRNLQYSAPIVLVCVPLLTGLWQAGSLPAPSSRDLSKASTLGAEAWPFCPPDVNHLRLCHLFHHFAVFPGLDSPFLRYRPPSCVLQSRSWRIEAAGSCASTSEVRVWSVWEGQRIRAVECSARRFMNYPLETRAVPRSLILVYCDQPPLLADGVWMAADLELPYCIRSDMRVFV